MGQKGFFAVTTAIILSILILMVSVSLSMRSFNTRFDSLGFESKDRSQALARGCLEEAIVNIRTSSTYVGSSTFSIGTSTCQIHTLTASGSDVIISTEAQVNTRSTKLQTLYRSSTNVILYTQELNN